MTIRTFTIDQLCLSPLNVRLNEEDANATGALEASIAARGLLFPLVVHPLGPGASAPWGVLAGGRRLRAIGKLVDAGRLPPDWPIDAVVRDVDAAEITEISLAENLLRRELRPYEVHAAIARAAAEGADAEEIAANIGQRVEWVRQQLRLGTLPAPIFEAYVEGKISADQAMAFASTADAELQAAAWAHFADKPEWESRPHQIRAWLKVGDRELARLLAFVGPDVYRAAGGRYELDLFADSAQERGRVVDEGKLRELAENKLAHIRQQARIASGDRDLRFVAEPPQTPFGSNDTSLAIDPGCPLDIRGERALLPAGDVVATIEIEPDGAHAVRFWWTSKKAKAAAARTDGVSTRNGSAEPRKTAPDLEVDGADAMANSYAHGQAARAAVKEEHGLTADGLQVMRSLRRALLRALLVEDADRGDSFHDGFLGRDYVIWAQLRQVLSGDRAAAVGARGLSSEWNGSEDAEPKEFVKPFLADAEAHAIWMRKVEQVTSHPAFAEEDPAHGLAAFLDADEHFRALAGTILAGFALMRSANVPGWRVPAHDELARRAGGDDAEVIRQYWQPSPDFMGLFPKMRRLELAQPFVDAEAFRVWPRYADRVTSGATAEVLAQACWVHPLLAFVSAETVPA